MIQQHTSTQSRDEAVYSGDLEAKPVAVENIDIIKAIVET